MNPFSEPPEKLGLPKTLSQYRNNIVFLQIHAPDDFPFDTGLDHVYDLEHEFWILHECLDTVRPSQDDGNKTQKMLIRDSFEAFKNGEVELGHRWLKELELNIFGANNG